MAERFAWADLLVCRAGAITAAEVAAAGRAAIFIPFGRATDSHQLRNAQAMVNAQAGRLITETELTGERLAREIFSLLDQPREIETLSTKARSLAYPHAASDIGNLIEAAAVDCGDVGVLCWGVKSEHQEVVEADKRKIPVIPRAEMLAELMRLKYGIAVAGAHGKTTTTSMVASILAAAHLDPTFVIGGKVNQAGTTARLGKGEYFVVEADESDRSFLMLAPVVAVVTTIDREHLDQYTSLEDIQGAFIQFVNRVPFYGAAILCIDEPNVQAIT